MSDDDYLHQILAEQQLEENSDELTELRERSAQVRDLLSITFSRCKFSIRYGGSKAKGTLVRESYDLDLVFYAHAGEEGAGATLEDIYFNIADALREEFVVEEKTCALRLHGLIDGRQGDDLKVDVVPGRYTDGDKSDCYLYQNGSDKDRLKTNLQIHIDHVKNSGVVDALCLLKLLRVRRGVSLKQFVWELLAIDFLEGQQGKRLSVQLEHVLSEIRDAACPPSVVDPANPTGNDFSAVLESHWPGLRAIASSVLETVDRDGWEGVFGQTEQKAARVAKLAAAARETRTPVRPWDPGRRKR